MNGLYKDTAGNQTWYRDFKYHREDGPAIIKADGSQFWYRDGILHRDDGPAIVWGDGDREWLLNGQLHRVDGPAIIWMDGAMLWYLNDRWIKSAKRFQHIAGLSDEAMLLLRIRYGEIE